MPPTAAGKSVSQGLEAHSGSQAGDAHCTSILFTNKAHSSGKDLYNSAAAAVALSSGLEAPAGLQCRPGIHVDCTSSGWSTMIRRIGSAGTPQREGMRRWRGRRGGRGRTWPWRCGCCRALRRRWSRSSSARLPSACPPTGTPSPAWQVQPLCCQAMLHAPTEAALMAPHRHLAERMHFSEPAD